MNCKHCTTEVSQKYCPNCGHPTVVRRIDGRYIFQEIRNVLNFEKGILFTIKELAIAPGKNIKAFLNENRNRLVKPILFLIVTSLIYTIINNFFQFEGGYINYSSDEGSSVTLEIFQWTQQNYGYANIMMAVFIALWLKLFFRRYKFNIFEILILLCFVMGMGMLIYSVFAIFEGLTHYKIMQIAGVFGFAYTTWAIGQFFEKGKVTSYVKAFFAYFLGMLTFSVLALLVGTILDLLIK